MKKVICSILCLAVIMGCFIFPQTDVEAYPTNWGEYSIDYVNDLDTKYSIVTEDEIQALSENVNQEIDLGYVLTLMARVHYLENHPKATLSSVPKDTVQYCIDNGIFDDCLENYDVPLTRGAFAYLVTNAIKDKNMLEINNIADGAIPDVEGDYFYKDAVYKCYKYGLIGGIDSKGTFNTETPITVYQTFIVLNRVMNPNLRQAVSLYAGDEVEVQSVEYPMYYKNTTKGLEINITKERHYDTDCYVANIKMSNPAHIKTIYSDLDWCGLGCEISTFNKRIDSIFMVNGDFRNKEFGAGLGIVRNRMIVNDKKFNKALGMDLEGNFVKVNATSAQSVIDKGIRDTWTFGPWLIENSKVLNVNNETRAPRTFIGQVNREDGILEYVIVVADGRSLTNAGLTMKECANILEMNHCDIGYNLDGGGSSVMMFRGKVLNDPCYGERADIDYIYIK